MVAHTMR